MEEKKFVAIKKDMYKIEDGKLCIESEELAKAIEKNGLDLFVDDAAIADIFGNCFGC